MAFMNDLDLKLHISQDGAEETVGPIDRIGAAVDGVGDKVSELLRLSDE